MNMIEQVALSILNSDRMAAGLTPVESRSGIPDSDGYVRNAIAVIQAMRDPTPEMIEAGEGRSGEAWICEGIPDDVIEAGIEAWEIAKSEMEDREMSDTPELMTDWDDGMVVAAIYKAMVARQAMIDASPIDTYEMEPKHCAALAHEGAFA